MMRKKTTVEAIKELEAVEFMFPNNQLGPAYRLPNQLPSLAESKANSVNQ